MADNLTIKDRVRRPSWVRGALGLAVLLAAAWLAAGIVRPPTNIAVVAISRVTDEVSIIQGGVGWFPRFASERLKSPREEGRAMVEVQFDGAFPQAPALTVDLVLRLEGDGRLPVTASSVRDLGWNDAWVEILAPSVQEMISQYSAEQLATLDQLWHQIFLSGDGPCGREPTAAISALFEDGEVRLTDVSMRPRLEPARVREMAAARILAASDPDARVVLIGFDGADWAFIDPLIARGWMPNLAGIIGRGARGLLDAPKPVISPPIWTSMVTGMRPEDHGILDFVTSGRDGETRPIASFDRRVPAAWNVASALGMPVGVVGWWATWPAEPVNGLLVSDRVTDVLMPISQGLEGLVSPQESWPEVERLRVEAEEVDIDLGRRFVRVSDTRWSASLIEHGYDDPVGGLRRILASTLTVDRCTRHIEATISPRLLMAYFEGIDTVGHLFAPYAKPKLASVSDADFAAFSEVGERYYRWIDGLLAHYARMIDEQTTLIIVSDHGFHWGDGRPAAPADPHTATAVWWHRPEGVFVAAGRGVRPGSVGRVRPVDIFPTILSLLGLPLDPAFQGSPLGWCLDDEVEGRAARRRPVDYQSLVVMERAAPTDLPAHEKRAVEAKLRALGYLDSSPSESDLVTARRLNNLGTSLLESGRSDEAEQSYREAIAIAPDYAAPYYNLMLLVFQRGAYDEAEQLFWSASERGLRERERAVVDFALAYLEKNERSRALGLLAEGRRRYPKSYTVTVNSGTVYANLGEFDEAAAEFRRAIELDPDSVVARNNLALILLRTGDQPDRVLEGRQLLMESLSIDPNQPEIREFLESRSSSNVR